MQRILFIFFKYLLITIIIHIIVHFYFWVLSTNILFYNAKSLLIYILLFLCIMYGS